ncbi:MAG: hydantoinase/oxoprolinase family protein [Nitrospinota bacterium]
MVAPGRRQRNPLVAATDIGGTFTAIVLLNARTGAIYCDKLLTTLDDPSIGAMAGLRKLLEENGLRLRDVGRVVHSTSLALDALLERRGARTGLLITKGFRDILLTGRELRYDPYELSPELPPPLVPGPLRQELTERISSRGDVLQPINGQEVRVVTQELADRGVESIAVCLLHSYLNPDHELAVEEVLAEAFPNISVSVSSRVCPEIREYERTTSVVVNAYVRPRVEGYMQDLEENLHPIPLSALFSHGGLASARAGAKAPVRMLAASAAGGGLAAAHFGRLAGFERVLSFEMGGTAATACLIEGGELPVVPRSEVARAQPLKRGSGTPILAPSVDLLATGGGGGSIARVESGFLRVGPESQGASPGPACYCMGGEEPTLTDANLLLGFLRPRNLLGEEMEVSPEAAAQAIRRGVAEPLRMGEAEAAWAVHEAANEAMASAIRVHLAERGKDPQKFVLLAMGGAGPVHAFRVARKVGIRRLVVPPAAAFASALGMLAAPFRVDSVDCYVSLLPELDFASLNRILSEREKEARALLRQAGVRDKEIKIRRLAEVSYQGQGHPLPVPLPPGKLGAGQLSAIEESFRQIYRETYGRTVDGLDLAAYSWRLTALGPRPEGSFRFRQPGGPKGSRRSPQEEVRRIYLPEFKGHRKVSVHERHLLRPGQRLRGPALVEEPRTTTVIGSKSAFQLDKRSNLIVDL